MTTPQLVVQPVEDDVDVATAIPDAYGATMRTASIECSRLREIIVYLEYTRDSADSIEFLLEGSDDGGEDGGDTWFRAQEDASGTLSDCEKSRAVTGSVNLAVRFDVTTLRHCRVSVKRTGGGASDTGLLSHNGSNG